MKKEKKKTIRPAQQQNKQPGTEGKNDSAKETLHYGQILHPNGGEIING